LFIDAGNGTPAPYAFSRLAPKRDATHSTHALSPEAVLDVYLQVRGERRRRPLRCACAAKVSKLGEGLTRDGLERLELAWSFIQTLMAEQSVEAWDRLARQSAPLVRVPA